MLRRFGCIDFWSVCAYEIAVVLYYQLIHVLSLL